MHIWKDVSQNIFFTYVCILKNLLDFPVNDVRNSWPTYVAFKFVQYSPPFVYPISVWPLISFMFINSSDFLSQPDTVAKIEFQFQRNFLFETQRSSIKWKTISYLMQAIKVTIVRKRKFYCHQYCKITIKCFHFNEFSEVKLWKLIAHFRSDGNSMNRRWDASRERCSLLSAVTQSTQMQLCCIGEPEF